MPKELMLRHDGTMVETRRFSIEVLTLILEQIGDCGRTTPDFYIVAYDNLLGGK